jgi:methylphosphotriester-DNA--protein-cysteine methyltransferase
VKSFTRRSARKRNESRLRIRILSRFHFCRAFKESTGLSPHAWLRQHRIEQAMKMLRNTDASIANSATAFLVILAMTFGLILPRMLLEDRS